MMLLESCGGCVPLSGYCPHDAANTPLPPQPAARLRAALVPKQDRVLVMTCSIAKLVTLAQKLREKKGRSYERPLMH